MDARISTGLVIRSMAVVIATRTMIVITGMESARRFCQMIVVFESDLSGETTHLLRKPNHEHVVMTSLRHGDTIAPVTRTRARAPINAAGSILQDIEANPRTKALKYLPNGR
jgi:hypothetical protein